MKKKKDSNKVIELLSKISGVSLGGFIFAYAINAIYKPFGFLSTGFNGISMMLNYLLDWPMAITSFVLNIVFVLVGIRLINREFAALSILGISSVSIFLDITKDWTLNIEDPIIAVVFGGLILGIGVGIALRSGGALGGMNILGKIVNKYIGLSIGSFDMMFNILIVIVAGILFDLNMAMYTIMARFVATKAIDTINEGFNRTKTVMIVSNKTEIIAGQLIEKVGRGVTILNGKGAYTGDNKDMIYCVVRLTQLGKLKQVVKDIDDGVFMSITDTKEVFGNGFS